MKYRYDSEAQEEYRNAIHFYGKAAERFFDAVESTIERIRNAPTQFREIEPGVRVFRVPNFPYAIYYNIESSEIIIRRKVSARDGGNVDYVMNQGADGVYMDTLEGRDPSS